MNPQLRGPSAFRRPKGLLLLLSTPLVVPGFMFNKNMLFLSLALVLACSPSSGQTQDNVALGTSGWLNPSLASQDDPWSEGIVGTGLLLRRLDGVKRVLLDRRSS